MVKKRRKIDCWRYPLTLAAIMLLTASIHSHAGEKARHPELSEQEMLIACAECHREATPEIEKQWFNSVHGIAMVKCYQCHGTFETFEVTPSRNICGACHANMLAKCPDNKPCWECHVPHVFKADK
ncbi:MAG: cytochrome c3 family protein [Desulforhopalus sp.]